MTTGTLPAVRRPGRAMTLWRLEWLRLTRTPRGIALASVFLFVGLVEPIVTRYERALIGHLSRGARISLPPPTPAAGLGSYVSEITLIGLLLVVTVAAGALTFDTRRGVSTFLRTRVPGVTALVLPRFAVSAAAAAVAYLIGTVGAWYETQVLLGPLPAGAVLAGVLCGAAYLVFAVAVTAFAASLARSVIGTVGIAVVILILVPIASVIHVIANWLPSALANAPVNLADGQHLAHFVPALAVTTAATAALLVIAVLRLGARQT
jgi:ABC-2 type transport system permease protein